MSAEVICEPRLGQTTIVQIDRIDVNVVLMFKEPDEAWEVALWHSYSEQSSWKQLNMVQTETGIHRLHSDSCELVARQYTSSLQKSWATNNSIFFTVKFRRPGQEWQWVHTETGIGDAEIIFQHDGELPKSFLHYFQNSDSPLSVTKCEKFAPEQQKGHNPSRVWEILTLVPAATEQSAFSHVCLGSPIQMVRWFCLVRESRPWLCPRQGRHQLNLKEEAILVSLLFQDGLHLAVLALSLDNILTVIKSDATGNLIISSRNEKATPGKGRVIVAIGETFEAASEAVMSHASGVAAQELSGIDSDLEAIRNNTSPIILEDWYDSFAYCTWNGLGQDLTEEKLYNALASMDENGIHFPTLIIDDNWQSIDDYGPDNFHHRWIEFEADKKVFPRGLKHTISTIKERFPWIKHVAVWHGILGYWNGISPNGVLAQRYNTTTLRKQDTGFLGGGSMVAVDAGDVEDLYSDFYRFLVECGVDAVKTDTQFLLDLIEDGPDRARFISAYQDAWMKASLHYFGGKAISCMSQCPQIIFRSQLHASLPTLLVRNSEDFFPDVPASHPWHIFCNAHTNILTQHLNILPDWDMFQTKHQFSSFHAAARCISGGPIYFTDSPGEHDINLIRQMTARNTEGIVILRPKVAKTTYVYASNKEKRLLTTATSTMKRDIPMLGIFNINDEPITEIVTLEHFSSRLDAEEYVLRAHTTGLIRLQDSTSNPMILQLGTAGHEILTAYPVYSLRYHTQVAPTKYAILGLLDKMTGAAAILDVHISKQEHGMLLKVDLKAMGRFGLHISRDGMSPNISRIKMCGEIVPSNSTKHLLEESIFEIDMELAWEEVGKVYKGRDIHVEMYIC